MIPAMFDLSGKVAVVTGSTKGIGKSIAQQMAAHGAKVVVSSRKADVCDAVAAEINETWARGDGEAVAIPCNVGREGDRKALIDGTMAKWGRIDSLVCNAAVNPYFGSLLEIPDEAFDKVIDVNVKANIRMVAMVAPQMKERRDGTIVIVSSVGGLRGDAKLGSYGISKAADIQLVRSLTAELGPYNIRSNCVAPAIVKTDFARALWEDEQRYATAIRTYPMGRIGEPEDVSGIVLMLASRAGNWITGQTIPVDGGMMSGIGR